MPPYLIPAEMLGFAVVGAVLLVMGSGFSTYIIDLRARTESADRIHQLSFNDTMTGLPNRIAFNERLAFDAAEAHEKAHKLARSRSISTASRTSTTCSATAPAICC